MTDELICTVCGRPLPRHNASRWGDKTWVHVGTCEEQWRKEYTAMIEALRQRFKEGWQNDEQNS